MGNLSDLCNPGGEQLNEENGAHFESIILHNRKQARALPPVPQPIKQKISRLLESQDYDHLATNSKVWEVAKPYKFYYLNQPINRDCVPCGLCTMYLYKNQGEFVGFFKGFVTNTGLRQSKGAIYVFANGDHFIGDKNKADFGTYVSQTEDYKYEGDWINNRAHGLGKETTKLGTYEGYFLYGKKHGKGKFKYPDGSIYDGEFGHNEVQGNGKITNEKQRYQFVGSFKAGLKEGKGREKTRQFEYEGNFANNRKTGKGKIKYLLEEIQYQGQFQNSKPHGQGKMQDKKGSTEGIWQQGRLIAIYPYKP